MVRTLDSILADINTKTDPQRATVLSQIADIPKQQAADEAALKAQQETAYGDIVNGARRRGLGFSGIPLGEQAQYSATQYLPAVAKLKTGYNDRATTLQSTLAGIDANNYAQANDIYNQERSFAEQQRQFDLNYALQQQAARQSAASNSSLAGLLGGQRQAAQAPSAQAIKKQNGGFAFTDAANKPISAATYAKQTGQDIRDVLYQMGQDGDQYSQNLYNQIAKDPFFTQNLGEYAKRYSPIFWGTA